MRESELLPILRSRVQGEVLAWTFLHPDEEYSVTDLARLSGSAVPTVHHEVTRLVDGGILRDRRVGRSRLVRANLDTRLAVPLTDLLAVTYGPLPTLMEAIAGISGIDEAYIYGSWAARYAGQRGPVPHDVDVLVIGTADRDELHRAADDVQIRIGGEINIRRVSVQAWASTTPEAFVETVRSQPLVDILRAAPVA